MRLHKILEPPCCKEGNTIALRSSADATNALEFFPNAGKHLRSNASKSLSTSSPKSNLCTDIYIHLSHPISLPPSHHLTPSSHSTTTAQTQPLPSKKYPPQKLTPKATSTRDFRPERSILLVRRRKRNGRREREVGELCRRGDRRGRKRSCRRAGSSGSSRVGERGGRGLDVLAGSRKWEVGSGMRMVRMGKGEGRTMSSE